MSDYTTTFERWPLKEPLLRGIYAYGFERPSLIQEKVIPIIITGKDVIAQAQSGTGKTGAFVIGTLQIVDCQSEHIQSLIISPTRELAMQTKIVFDDIGQYSHIRSALCVGGTDMRENIRSLSNAHVLIGTPGRLIELSRNNYFSTSDVKIIILDEADELLTGDFQIQVKNIIVKMPTKAQICFFSATYTDSIISLSSHIMNEPSMIRVERDELTLDGIKQFIIDLEEENWKFDTLIDVFGMINITQSIVYVNSVARADRLQIMLENKKCAVSVIHGGISSVERMKVLTNFRKGQSRILISTDLLSRGIDIQQLSVVINYDFPRSKETYLHRIGRSGRYGRKGIAINFVTRYDYENVKMTERYYETKFMDMPQNVRSLLN